MAQTEFIKVFEKKAAMSLEDVARVVLDVPRRLYLGKCLSSSRGLYNEFDALRLLECRDWPCILKIY